MIAFQFGERLWVDHRLEVKLDAQLRQHFNFAQALDQRQLIFGHAVGIQASWQRPRVVENGPDAAPPQFCGTGERGWSGADKRHGKSGVGCRCKGQRSAACVE